MWLQLMSAIACIIMVQTQQSTTSVAAPLTTIDNDMFFFKDDDDYVPAASESSVYTMLMAGGSPMPRYHKHHYVQYMVSLRSRHEQQFFGDNHFCAGTIIGANIVLTAAHCVLDKRGALMRPRRMIVIAGTPQRTQNVSTTLRYDVQQLVAQPSTLRDHSNKLAIVRVKGGFPHGNIHVRVLHLPRTFAAPPYDRNCTMIGWGRMYNRGPLSDIALHVNVTVLEELQCEQMRSDINTKGLLCAVNTMGCDTCPGDTGGPLICDGELTGVIAWNLLCGNITLPTVFIEVPSQINWIRSVLSSGGERNACSILPLYVGALILVVFFNF